MWCVWGSLPQIGWQCWVTHLIVIQYLPITPIPSERLAPGWELHGGHGGHGCFYYCAYSVMISQGARI